MSWSMTSAASAVSPDLNVRSTTRPVFRLRIFTRLNAWPLPGLTILVLDDRVRIAVEQDLDARREFVGAVNCHATRQSPENASAGSYPQAPRNTNSEARSRSTPRITAARPPLARATPRAACRLASGSSATRSATRPSSLRARAAAGALGARGGARFPLLVPRGFVARMRKRRPARPAAAPGPGRVAAEPSSYRVSRPIPCASTASPHGGLHPEVSGPRAADRERRVPVHCRYCFRRAVPVREQLAARGGWDTARRSRCADASDHARSDLERRRPVEPDDRRLANLSHESDDTSVRTLRIHTRFPDRLPERVDAGLLDLLARQRSDGRGRPCNHANEIDEESATRCAALRRGVGRAAEPVRAAARRQRLRSRHWRP